jgi:hypothetical protein
LGEKAQIQAQCKDLETKIKTPRETPKNHLDAKILGLEFGTSGGAWQLWGSKTPCRRAPFWDSSGQWFDSGGARQLDTPLPRAHRKF